MSQAQSEWIVGMHYAFQDDQYLYMAMEYMAGMQERERLEMITSTGRALYMYASFGLLVRKS